MTAKRQLIVVASVLSLLISHLWFSATANAGPCLDPASDPDGDGWGYENGQSCTVESGPANNSGNRTCIDLDGDGWGWNGVESCQLQTSAAECVDLDGDGWGWNGVESCTVASNMVPSAMQSQTTTVQVQSAPASPPVSSSSPPLASAPVTAPASVTAPPSTPASVSTAASCTAVLSSGANLYNAVANTTGRICLRPGVYSLPQNLSFRSNQTLAALDASNPPVINTTANRTFSTTGQSNVSLENIIIDGNRNGAREFAILVGNGSRNISINNVTIRNTFGIGIGITRSTNVTIRGGTITNIGLDTRLRQAVWTAFSSVNVTIDGLTVRGRQSDQAGGDHAITCIDSVNGFTVTNTRSEYAGSGAVAINNCSNIVVTNNELHNGREHGVDIVNGAIGALVTGNNITGFDRSAMVFDDHSWQCEGCGTNPTEITVRNNRMTNNNRVNLARCKGIAVDSQMVINPSSQQLNRDWVRITADNQVDSDSALYCQHIH